MICVGKSLGKPKYGCPMCSACDPYLTDGELYTLGDLFRLHQVFKDKNKIQRLLLFVQGFVEGGSDLKTQRQFQNVVNQPLLTGGLDKKVIEIICVPELHLLLGNISK